MTEEGRGASTKKCEGRAPLLLLGLLLHPGHRSPASQCDTGTTVRKTSSGRLGRRGARDRIDDEEAGGAAAEREEEEEGSW